MKAGKRWIAPLIGVIISVAAHFAQNVWQILHINDLTNAIKGLDHAGVLLGFFVIGMVEGTILLCFYLPGTAVVILLLASLQPTLTEGIELLTWLMAGTMVGYGISLALGKALGARLPSLVGGAYFYRVQSLIERFGLVSFAPASFHPNHLALAFAVLGYFRARRIWLYFAIAALAQAAWWLLYASLADVIFRQSVVSSSNFQLYLAALFSVWLIYELLPARQTR
jgi:membrane protein DedA with SNARE-associated domain